MMEAERFHSIAKALETIATGLLSRAFESVTRPKLMVRPSLTTRASASTYDRYLAGLADIGQVPFLQRFNAENRKALKISSPAMDLLVGYDWPGNVRELENCIERMVVMARREVIAPEDVPLPISIYAPTPPPRVLFSEPTASTLPKAVADIERERLLEALRRSGGVQTRAAALLGITPRQLGYKLKKYHIAPKMVLG